MDSSVISQSNYNKLRVLWKIDLLERLQAVLILDRS